MSDAFVYGGRGKQWLLVTAASCVLLLLLSLSLLPERQMHSEDPLTVYCAAGLRLPVEAVAAAYQEEFGIPVRLDYGSSGAMETRLRQDVQKGLQLCDVFIPADNSFARRCRDNGITRESIPLAQFSLVYASPGGQTQELHNMQAVLTQHQQFAVCDVSAAAGKKTKRVLEQSGHWQALQNKGPRSAATVVEAAGWIRDSGVIEGGFIWNTTAKQHGLVIHELSELQQAVSTITANVSSACRQPARALHFMRYLQAPSKGAVQFKQHYFNPVPGDHWADKPEIVFYAGGLNRESVKDLLHVFSEREGVQIKTKYGGCGMLVSDMRALQDLDGMAAMPDVFLTCDASYMDKVSDSFTDAVDVSSTQVVIMVAKGNPKNITSLRDLAREDVRAATTNPSFSTLGDLSWQLLAAFGIDAETGRKRHIVASATTAHDLILQMQSHNILDCALVYQANVMHMREAFDLIPIDHPRALAVQNIAPAKQTRYPWLTKRLLGCLTAAQLRTHYEQHGFKAATAASAND